MLMALLFYSLSCFAQNGVSGIEVEYKQFNNTDSPNTIYCTLYADKDIAVFFQKYSTANSENKSDGTLVFKPTFVFEPYTKIDHVKKQILFFETIKTTVFLVEDNYNKLEWVITDENKTIAGYKCLKATTTFRGRKWIAWFTPDIPIASGPWKLYGLPGLILEISSVDNVYSIQAQKNAFKRDVVLDKDFSKLYAAKNNTPITYQKYLKDYQEYLDNAEAELRVMMPNAKVINPTTKKDMEFDFEWDN